MNSFEEFKEVVRRLRAPGGCPWDREQTHASLKPGCIEEACEVICGINVYEQTGNPENLKEELGDLLFSVCNLARHLGVDAESALEGASAKFARRFRAVEAAAKAQGRSMKDMSLAEMDALWDEAKRSGAASDLL